LSAWRRSGLIGAGVKNGELDAKTRELIAPGVAVTFGATSALRRILPPL
jgi:hypothetical protein